MAKKKLHLERLDKHSFWLKVAALTAKSLCLIPILNFILLIYALVLGDKQDAAEQAMAQALINGGNNWIVASFYLICIPAMIWGFFLYYFDALVGAKKKGKKKPNTAPVKIVLSILLYAILGGLNVLLLWKVNHNPLVFGLCFIGILVFAYWGYGASVKSYSEVLSLKTLIVIACIYIFYLLASGFIAVASSSKQVLNGDPVVLGVCLFGALGFVVMNQATVDYEMQNQDAESADARRGIQKFNFRVSLVLVAALAVLYFARGGVAWLLTTILKGAQSGVSAVAGLFRDAEGINFDDVSKDYSVSVEHDAVSQVEHTTLIDKPELVFFITLAIAIALIIVFRKQILKALRKSVKWFSKLFSFKTYSARGTSQYYRDLVEEVDEDEASRLFAGSVHNKRSNRALVKEYDKLRDPNQRVRRALPVMRTLFSTTQVEFEPGDTVRDTARRIDGESSALRDYARVYEAVRYDDAEASPAEADAAAALVHGAYEQAKAYKPAKKDA